MNASTVATATVTSQGSRSSERVVFVGTRHGRERFVIAVLTRSGFGVVGRWDRAETRREEKK